MLLKLLKVLMVFKFYIESANKSSLIELLTQLKVFSFKKMVSEDKTKFDNFYLRSKAELSIKGRLMMCLNQYILKL